MARLAQFLSTLDRRWVFLVMGVAVLIPVVFRMEFPERPTALTQAVFDRIESLPAGSRVLMAWDYDPGSAPELQPMATALAWHAARRDLKLYFVTLWAAGLPMVNETIDNVIRKDFPEYKYGEDYVNLGYKSGNEGVVKVVVSNLGELFPTDVRGQPLSALPMTSDLKNIRDMDLILNVSAGYPGAKEWIQYAATPLNIPIAAGCTGVQATLLYPYIPSQLFGLLAAIKGAAEYEAALAAKYPDYARDPDSGADRPDRRLGIRRMGPQLIAHCVVMMLIIAGNLVLALQSATRRGARA